MRRLSGFSLMEMMIVLLIVAIIAAASAPMISKKMAGDGAGGVGSVGCGWLKIGENSVFNFDEKASTYANASAIIGAKVVKGVEKNKSPRLFINVKKDKKNPHIQLGVENAQKANLSITHDLDYWFTSTDIAESKGSSVAFGYKTVTGQSGISVGHQAKSGTTSVAIGYSADSNKVRSVAIGAGASASGNNSVALGVNTNATEGSVVINNDTKIIGANCTNVVAIGSGAKGINGANAILIGGATEVGSIKAGVDSIAIGATAMTGGSSVAIGYEVNAGYDKDKDKDLPLSSVAIGSNAHTASYSTAIGVDSYVFGENAVALGQNSTADANYAIALGSDSGASEGASAGVAIGKSAKVSSNYTVAIGYQASASGQNAVAIGGSNVLYSESDAQAASASADDTIAVGTARATKKGAIGLGHAAFATGEQSIAIGSMMKNVYGNYVVTQASGSGSTALGAGAQAETSATALGHMAKAGGYASVALGESANATGTDSSAIGPYTTTSTHRSAAIGRGAQAEHEYSMAIGITQNNLEYPVKTTASNQIVLGHKNTTVYIPGNLVVDQNVVLSRKTARVYTSVDPLNSSDDGNRLYLLRLEEDKTAYVSVSGDNSRVEEAAFGDSDSNVGDAAFPRLGIKRFNSSDRRLKNVGEVFKGGLDEIKKLEVFNYTYKKDKDKTPRVGVMAQDLQKIFPNAVVKGDDGFLRIRMEDMFYALVNAVKELDRKIDLLIEKQKKIDELEKRVDTLEKRLAKLEKQMKEK